MVWTARGLFPAGSYIYLEAKMNVCTSVLSNVYIRVTFDVCKLFPQTCMLVNITDMGLSEDHGVLFPWIGLRLPHFSSRPSHQSTASK